MFMKKRKHPGMLIGLLLAGAGWWPAAAGAAGEAATSTTALRADLTDQMLRALAAAPELAPRAAEPASTATQKMLRPSGGKLVITARPTSATVALRQGTRTLLAGNRITSATRVTSATTATLAKRLPKPALPPLLERPAVPTEIRMLAASAELPAVPEPVAAMVTAPVARLETAVKPEAEHTTGTVRINQAGAEELREKLKLDGTRARLVIEFRRLYGTFKTPEDLSQVSGITEAMVKAWDEAKILIFD